jgi:hypothetical protein
MIIVFGLGLATHAADAPKLLKQPHHVFKACLTWRSVNA